MRITRFYLPTRLIVGWGSLAQLGLEAKMLGKRAMLVTGAHSMRKAGVLDKVTVDLKSCGVDVVVFDKVESNPRASTVDAGARIAREREVDLVIGLGGGSVMDAAKGIALASSGTESIWNYTEAGINVKEPVPPLILVPTIAASGSETNDRAVITNWDNHDKIVLASPYFAAVVSIVDPELTVSLPEKPTLQGGVDILCHLLEPYITDEKPSPLTDGILEAAMMTVVEYLPKALSCHNDIQARTQLSWASTIACSQFAQLGGGGGAMTLHGIEHPLSGYYDIAHGDGLAALLPEWIRYTLSAMSERVDSVGKNVFNKADGILAIEQWLGRVGMNIRLSSLGVELDRLDELAACAVRTAPWLKYHPKTLDAAAIRDIYRNSY